MSPEKTSNPAGSAEVNNPIPKPRETAGRAPENAKGVLARMYEGLYKIPGVSRMVGKMEIAYNNSRMKSHEGKAVSLKDEIDDIDCEIATQDRIKKDTEALIATLEKQEMPESIESLRINLREADEEKAKLFNKRDRLQSKLEAREHKAGLYVNRRDTIADKLIGRYNEKLDPMERRLESLNTCRDLVDLRSAVTEARHKELLARLAINEEERKQIENILIMKKKSEKEIKKNNQIMRLEKLIARGREQIRVEKEYLAKEIVEIDKKVAKVDEKANPYRDKREEFIRVKEGRPVKIEIEARKKGNEFSKKEDIKPHTRQEGSSAEEVVEEAPPIVATAETAKKEKVEQAGTIGDYIDSWNKWLKKTYKKDADDGLINQADFLGVTNFKDACQVEADDFKKIFGKYLKYKKLPADKFNQNIDKFIEEKMKSKKK